MATTPLRQWQSWIERHPALARTDWRGMVAVIDQMQLDFGKTPVPCILQPNLLSNRRLPELRRDAEWLLRVMERCLKFVLAHPEHPWWRGIPPATAELLRLPNPLKRQIWISRLDGCLLDNGGMRYFECNADSPAGFAYATILQEALMRTRLVREIQTRHALRTEHPLRRLAGMLMDAARGQGRETPCIAIADWRTVKTRPEFVIVAQELEWQGARALICDPRDFTRRAGGLYLGRERIDLVYRRALVHELAERRGECRALLGAAAAGETLIINPFASAIGSSKLLFALLRQGEFDALLSDNERRLVKRIVPKTFPLSTAFQTHASHREPVGTLAAERRRWVLKPFRSNGGDDLHMGHATPAADWRRLLRRDDLIAQEHVRIPIARTPFFEPALQWHDMHVITNPFILAGRYAGSLTRIAGEEVVNVNRGGMVQPTLLWREK